MPSASCVFGPPELTQFSSLHIRGAFRRRSGLMDSLSVQARPYRIALRLGGIVVLTVKHRGVSRPGADTAFSRRRPVRVCFIARCFAHVVNLDSQVSMFS